MKITAEYSGIKMALGVGKARLTEAGGTEAHHAQLESYAAKLRAIIEGVMPSLQAIGNDGRLSDQGKRASTQEHLVRAWNQLEGVTEPLFRELGQVTEQVESKIAVKPFASGNPVVDEMQAQEVRALIRPMENSKVRYTYMRLCESGADTLFIHAVETAPVSFPILPLADIQKGRDIRAKNEHPQEVKEVAILKVLRNAYEYLLHHSKRVLKDIGLNSAEFDWGRIILNPTTGTISIGTMRPYTNPEITRKNVTTPSKAKAAGYDADAAFLNADFLA